MNKTILLVSLTVFGAIGGYIPFLFGETDLFGPWSILGSTVGGLVGIWVGIWISKNVA
jgi:hypothetical protein